MDIGIILAIGGIIGTFFFGIVSIHFYKKTSRFEKEIFHLNEERRRITWSDLLSESQELKGMIERDFKPGIIFTPCRRGATIANLMFGIGENILLYVGIREDIRKDHKGEKFESPPKGYEVIPKTGKYKHYIPIGLLDEKKNVNLLILDDFVDSGDSLKAIVDFLGERGFQRDKIKTAAIVCTKTALGSRKAPNFFPLEMDPDFYFPWGKAR